MKLYGNNGRKKKKAPKKYDYEKEDTSFNGSFDDDDSPKRTREELRQIDEMIERYQRFKRRRRVLIFLFLVVIVAAGAILWNIYIRPPEIINPTPTPSATPSAGVTPTTSASAYTRKDGVYTFVLLGKDVEANLTDTILIGRIDTVNNTLNIANIPRDTLVNVSRSYKKINGLYSHNNFDIEKAKAELKSLLGFTVDSYAIIDIRAFEKIVDTIGGVDFDVPVNMDYDDEIQDFYVHLRAGMQHLDGAAALGVVRFRENNEGSPYGPGYPRADIDRIATQQALMKEVAKKCLTIGNATKINEFAQIFKDYIDTNLSTGNFVWFGLQFLNIKSENINFMTMPGKYDDYALDISCVTVALDDWLNMINTCLNPYKEPITKDGLNVLTRDSDGKLYSTSGNILS